VCYPVLVALRGIPPRARYLDKTLDQVRAISKVVSVSAIVVTTAQYMDTNN